MKIYRGIREPLCHVRVLDDGPGGASTLPESNRWGLADAGGRVLAVPRELISQPLAPLDWGADGAGTHYLAVAILADLLGARDRAGIKAALPFMRRFLSRLPKDGFEIADTVFRAFVQAVVGPSALPAPGEGARQRHAEIPPANEAPRHDGGGSSDH